jgi:hypothetical protein
MVCGYDTTMWARPREGLYPSADEPAGYLGGRCASWSHGPRRSGYGSAIVGEGRSIGHPGDRRVGLEAMVVGQSAREHSDWQAGPVVTSLSMAPRTVSGSAGSPPVGA